MKHSILLASAIALGLAGCANNMVKQESTEKAAPADKTPAFEQVVHLAYQCMGNDAKPSPLLVVSYGIVNNEPVAAQLNIADSTSPALMRVTDAPNAEDSNVFFANGFRWSTERANLQELAKAQGIMLTRQDIIEVNGTKQEVDSIILKSCTVDIAATKGLVQQAAQ